MQIEKTTFEQRALSSGLSDLNAIQQWHGEKSIAGEAQAPISPLTAASFVQTVMQPWGPPRSEACFISTEYILLSCFCYRQCYRSFQRREYHTV